MMKSFIVFLLICTGVAAQTLSFEQSARNEKLQIDHDCSPGFFRRAHLATASTSTVRFFWIGQKYALDREVKDQVEMIRSMAIDSVADARIAAINEQRDRAQGFPAMPYDARVARELADADRFNRKFDQDLLTSTRAWATKCQREIDEIIRGLDGKK